MKKHTSKLAILGVAAWTSLAFAGNPSQHIDGKNYKVDVSAANCKAGAECSAVVKITVGEGYHLNKDYPYKVVPPEQDKLPETLKYAKKDFGRASGDYVEASETVGTITVKFTAAKSGKIDIGGKLRLAVCSKSECATGQEDIKLPVEVKAH